MRFVAHPKAQHNTMKHDVRAVSGADKLNKEVVITLTAENTHNLAHLRMSPKEARKFVLDVMICAQEVEGE